MTRVCKIPFKQNAVYVRKSGLLIQSCFPARWHSPAMESPEKTSFKIGLERFLLILLHPTQKRIYVSFVFLLRRIERGILGCTDKINVDIGTYHNK